MAGPKLNFGTRYALATATDRGLGGFICIKSDDVSIFAGTVFGSSKKSFNNKAFWAYTKIDIRYTTCTEYSLKQKIKSKSEGLRKESKSCT